MSETEWHGWAKDEPNAPTLMIGPLPGRKRVALSIIDQRDGHASVCYPLAYFVSEAAARDALELFDMIASSRGAKDGAA